MISYIIYIIILISIIYFFIKIVFKRINYIRSKIINFLINKKSDTDNCVEILKNKYGIKSTERIDVNLKFIVNKPSFLNVNKDCNNVNIDVKKYDELKFFMSDKNNYRIIKSYISNKKIFINTFIKKNSELKITNLKTFSVFHKNNFNCKNAGNILLKFYNSDNDYLYIFVNGNNLIKILNFGEYDKITKLIENDNNIFLINKNNENYITHGGYVNCDVSKKELKKIFFNNSNKINKNYNILINYKSVKIFFYTSTLI